MSLERRTEIHFLWLKHTAIQAILSELEEVYGKEAIALRVVDKWIPAFDGWRTELADLPRSGRPRETENVDAVRAQIEGD
jgi:hypothetical protein